MIKRLISSLLICCLIIGFAPDMARSNLAFAAAENAALESFSVTCTGADGTSQITSLLDGSLTEVSLPAGASYSFEVSFHNNDAPADVYVTSTTDAGKVFLPAVYSQTTDSFLTYGYFNGSSVYLPGTVGVEYFRKPTQVQVGENFSLSGFQLSGVDREDITADVSNNGKTVLATVNLSNLVNSEGDAFLQAVVDTYLPSLSGDLDEDADLMEWLGKYSDLDQLMRYTVPGVDNDQYLLYLDYSDPATYAMIVHDVTGNQYTKMILTGMAKDNPKALLTFSEQLADISEISGMIHDYTSITSDMDDLREGVRLNTSLTMDQAEEAYARIDRLERDKQMFSLMTTFLPMLTNIAGVAGGPPGVLFSAMLWYISASSDFFWEKRIGAIPVSEINCTWTSSGTCGKENPNDVVWELKNGILTFSGKGEMTRGRYCPFDNTAVKKVIINSGITNADITYSVLTPMMNLTEVVLPSTLTSIERICFYGCASLKEITLPDSLQSIHAQAFAGCTALESITIPASVTTLGSQTFLDCTALETVCFESGCNPTVAKEGVSGVSAPFNRTENLKQVIFEGDYPTDLISVNNSDGLPRISDLLYLSGSPTFYYPADNKTWTDIAALWQANWSPTRKMDCVLVALGGPSGFCGDNVTWEMDLEGNLFIRGTGEMYDYYSSKDPAWSYVDNLCFAGVAEGVTSIGREAFKNCTNLRDVYIGETVETIGRDAFANCASLEWLRIPASVTEGLSSGTFTGCSAMQQLYVDESNPIYFTENSVLYSWEDMELIFCPQGNSGIVQVAPFTQTIGYAAFQNCKYITQVCIPDTVTLIDSNAFYGCTALTDIYYEGSEIMWNNIDIWDSTLTGGNLLNIHYWNYPSFIGIELYSDCEDGGTVSGGGIYIAGQPVQLTAVPNKGYRFDGWMTIDGILLSTESTCTLYLWENTCLVALFIPQPSFTEQPVILTDSYSKTHEVEIMQTGSLVTVEIATKSGSELPDDMYVWVAEFAEDGRMIGITAFQEVDSSSGRAYAGNVPQSNTILYILDEVFNPVANACESRLLIE